MTRSSARSELTALALASVLVSALAGGPHVASAGAPEAPSKIAEKSRPIAVVAKAAPIGAKSSGTKPATSAPAPTKVADGLKLADTTKDAPPPKASPFVHSRSFLVDVKPGDAKSVRMVEIVATCDPAEPSTAIKAELRVGKIDQPPEQVLTFPVEAGWETVLASADVVDLNFDGLRDFWVLREMGAKWNRFEAYVYDGRAGRFVKDGFAKEISQLDNPEVDEMSKIIVTRSLGPAEPYRTVRKVQGGHTFVVESCAFHNGKDTNGDDKNDGLLVIQKTVGNALRTVSSKEVSIGLGENPCAE